MKLRIWRLGSLEPFILPSQACQRKLADLIEAGEADIIWDKGIEFREVPLTKLEVTTSLHDINVVTSVDFPFEKFHDDFSTWWEKWKEENL